MTTSLNHLPSTFTFFFYFSNNSPSSSSYSSSPFQLTHPRLRYRRSIKYRLLTLLQITHFGLIMYFDLSCVWICLWTDCGDFWTRTSEKTSPAKVAKMAPKATPRRPLASSRALSGLNDQDVLTLWHAFRNNGGNSVSILMITKRKKLSIDFNSLRVWRILY